MCLRTGLLCLVFGLALGSSGAAQTTSARLELHAGRTFHGELVSLDLKQVVIRVDGRELTFQRDEISALEMGRPGAKTAEEEQLSEKVREEVLGPVDATEEETPAAQAPATAKQTPRQPSEEKSAPVPARSPATASGRRGSHDRRIADLLDRYIWVVPSQAGSRFGVGAALLVAFSLLLGLSERIANAPKNGFGRSVGFAVLLATIGGVGASALPLAPMPLAGLAMVAVLAHMSGSIAIFGCKLLNAFVAFLSFILVSLLSVALLELLGVLLSARDMM